MLKRSLGPRQILLSTMQNEICEVTALICNVYPHAPSTNRGPAPTSKLKQNWTEDNLESRSQIAVPLLSGARKAIDIRVSSLYVSLWQHKLLNVLVGSNNIF